MSFLDLLSTEWTNTLGYTFLHTLWIGAIIGLATLLILRSICQKPPRLKYVIASAGLAAMLVAFMAVIAIYWPSGGDVTTQQPTHEVVVASAPVSAVTTDTASTTFWQAAFGHMEQYFPYLAFIWLLGTCFFMVKTLIGWLYVKQLKIYQTVDVPLKYQKLFNRWKTATGITRRIRIKESALATVPMTIGHFRPFIILPAGTLSTLSVQQLQMIILHELAHIHRYDYLINLLQSFVEAVLFFHPAVWWVSSEIRKHREHSCDDLAVAWGGSRKYLAEALANISDQPLSKPSLALGFANKNFHLLHRIKRLITQQEIASHSPVKFVLMIAIVIFAMILSSTAFEQSMDQPLEGQTAATTATIFTKPDISSTAPPAPTEVKVDTPKGEIKVVRKFDEGPYDKVKLKMDDGKIEKLKIDGKRIEEDEYQYYEELISELVPDYGKDEEERPFSWRQRRMLPRFDGPPAPPAPPMPPRMGSENMPPPPDMPRFHWHNQYSGADSIIIQYDSAGKQRQVIIRMDSIPSRSFEGFDDDYWKEFRKSMEIYRKYMDEEYSESMREYQEEMREYREEMREMQEEMQEEMQDEMRERREMEREERHRIRKERMEQMDEARDNRVDKIGNKLKEMGLTEDSSKFTLMLQKGALVVNGKAQDQETYDEFVQWYEKEFKREITEKVNINISVN